MSEATHCSFCRRSKDDAGPLAFAEDRNGFPMAEPAICHRCTYYANLFLKGPGGRSDHPDSKVIHIHDVLPREEVVLPEGPGAA